MLVRHQPGALSSTFLPIRAIRWIFAKSPGDDGLGGRAADRVPVDGGQELRPSQAERGQGFCRSDRRRTRYVTKERDLTEVVAAGQGRPGGSPHAYRGGSPRHEVELVPDLALTDDDAASGEMMRTELGRDEFGHRQGEGCEHREVAHQLEPRAGCGHRPVESAETRTVAQGQR